MAYLPMAWIGDHIFSYGQAFCSGFTVNCPESTETVVQDQKEIGPTYIFAPPPYLGKYPDPDYDQDRGCGLD